MTGAAGISAEPSISVVIPCRNEEDNVVEITAAVAAELERAGESFEIILIDNGSTDRTVELARQLCAADARVKVIVNTRNFGQMRSPTYGIFQARGRAVIGMCADFQDPPELLGKFVERWRAGADIVLGVRQSEKSPFVLRNVRAFSYWVARVVGEYPLIPNATGFGLYDRRVVDAIASMREPEPFFRGMLVETGYPIELIGYRRPPRSGGRSNNNFFTLLDFALSGFAGASKKLMRLPFLASAVTLIAAVVSLLIAFWQLIAGRPTAFWFASAAVELQLGVIFGFLGMIGDQVRLVSERTRNTPLVLERERINFPAETRP